MKFTTVTKQIGEVINKNSPAILTGMAVSGVVATAVMAVKATPKALDLISEGMENKNRIYRDNIYSEFKDGPLLPDFEHQFLTPKEIFLATWECYLPAAIMGGVTVACIIGANTINTNRNAALAGLYSIAETTLKEYKEQIAKNVGKTKSEKIKADVAQEIIKQNPITTKTVVINAGGDQLCFDRLSGRYFKSTIQKIKEAQNNFNAKLIDCCWLDLNDLYDFMGLEAIGIGENIGWNNNKLLEFDFSTIMSENDEPCIFIDYEVMPTADFREF